jgi:hypothetical protein
MIPAESPERIPIRGRRNPTPQFGEDDGAITYEPVYRLHAPSVAIGAKLIHKNRGIENDEITHRDPRRKAFLHAFSSKP